jgi:hypothetical protein
VPERLSKMTGEDITDLLANWPYQDDEGPQVRVVRGRDGVAKLQLRIDLGLMHMELEGRPDGRRPYGAASLLDHYRERAEEHRRYHGWYEGFELGHQECAALRQESLQYYHRRIALLALQDYERAVLDADHNLQIIDLVKAFARDRDDWMASEQFRAYILTHRIQALTLQHLRRDDVEAAILEVERGMRQLRSVFAEQGRGEEAEGSDEHEALDDLRRKLEARYQVSHRQRLQLLLDDALRREEPDLVAELRGQLRELEVEE